MIQLNSAGEYYKKNLKVVFIFKKRLALRVKKNPKFDVRNIHWAQSLLDTR